MHLLQLITKPYFFLVFGSKTKNPSSLQYLHFPIVFLKYEFSHLSFGQRLQEIPDFPGNKSESINYFGEKYEETWGLLLSVKQKSIKLSNGQVFPLTSLTDAFLGNKYSKNSFPLSLTLSQFAFSHLNW